MPRYVVFVTGSDISCFTQVAGAIYKILQNKQSYSLEDRSNYMDVIPIVQVAKKIMICIFFL